MTADQPSVTYVIGTYPLLTTTFIDREIREMRRSGIVADVVSLRQPPADLSDDQRELAATTAYVRPVSIRGLAMDHARFFLRRPARYVSTLARMVAGRGQTLRERLKTIGHFGLAVHVTGVIERRGVPDRIHAHFIDRAAAMAHVASRLLDVPYSITAHARDIYVDAVLLDLKIKDADFVATCTGYNHTHLSEVVDGADTKVEVLYHGLEVAKYEPGCASNGSAPTFVSVGQLRPKKGFVDLLHACRRLVDDGLDFRVVIVGEGPQRPELEALIDELGLGGRVELRGRLPHDAVIATYQESDAFVLPCVVADDGDRDGIPNVILEAMAMELPVVSTAHSGIPEAVVHDETGLLVQPGDVAALADAMSSVIASPDRRRTMGAAGRAIVIDRFDATANTNALLDRFVQVGRS